MENKMKKTKEDRWWEEPYHCWNCGGESGYGRGIEPTRYDIAWCSSKCHEEFWERPIGRKK
tara:strand:- start:264 stop:446 length:183 start_codon:yes stop_codon:yes gene_type:complete